MMALPTATRLVRLGSALLGQQRRTAECCVILLTRTLAARCIAEEERPLLEPGAWHGSRVAHAAVPVLAVAVRPFLAATPVGLLSRLLSRLQPRPHGRRPGLHRWRRRPQRACLLLLLHRAGALAQHWRTANGDVFVVPAIVCVRDSTAGQTEPAP